MMAGRRAEWVVRKVVKGLILALTACTVMSYVVMRLWNWLMPELFHLHTLRWTQALGLLVLSKILLGGFHKHGHGGATQWKQNAWKRRMRQKWSGMSPDERDRFRQGMRKRWGDCGDCVGWKTGQPKEPVTVEVRGQV